MTMFAGHVIDQVSEVPLVVTDKIQAFTKTKEAVSFLKQVNAWADIEKVCWKMLLNLLFFQTQ